MCFTSRVVSYGVPWHAQFHSSAALALARRLHGYLLSHAIVGSDPRQSQLPGSRRAISCRLSDRYTQQARANTCFMKRVT